jgi:hypothetical protein
MTDYNQFIINQFIPGLCMNYLYFSVVQMKRKQHKCLRELCVLSEPSQLGRYGSG